MLGSAMLVHVLVLERAGSFALGRHALMWCAGIEEYPAFFAHTLNLITDHGPGDFAAALQNKGTAWRCSTEAERGVCAAISMQKNEMKLPFAHTIWRTA